jgi:hypothetical protein
MTRIVVLLSMGSTRGRTRGDEADNEIEEISSPLQAGGQNR